MELSFAKWLTELNHSIPLSPGFRKDIRNPRDTIDWNAPDFDSNQATRAVLQRAQDFKSGPNSPEEVGPGWEPRAIQPSEVPGWRGGAADNIAAVIKGTKRIAWIEVGQLFPNKFANNQELVAYKLRKIAVDNGLILFPKGSGYLLGKEQDVRELDRLLQRAEYLQNSPEIEPSKRKWVASIHSQIGHLLGYNPEQVAQFIQSGLEDKTLDPDENVPHTPHDRIIGYASKVPKRESRIQ